MTDGLVIEVARPRDAAEVNALHLRVLAEGGWFITEPNEFAGSAEQKAQQIHDLERSPNSLFLVARQHGDLVGFLTLSGGVLRRMRHTSKLEIMVDKQARGRGVGRALMRAAIAWARKSPLVQKIGLNVFADNERAVALYESLGFQREGHRQREYKMPDGTFRDDLLLYLFTDQPLEPPV